MFAELEPIPQDPILGLTVAFREDTNPAKVDLGVGVYRDEAGNTPVMRAVRQAEQHMLASQDSKSYLPPAGVEGFLSGMESLLLGPDCGPLSAGRVRTVQTPGGCGALRLGAELIARARPGASVWVSAPTWANHVPLLSEAGLNIKEYPYYDAATHGIDETGMFGALEQAVAGDVVLVHGCCHNPSGADLSLEQWQRLAELCASRGVLPYVDVAYLGLGDGLDVDGKGLQQLVAACDEMLIASSCSKNFGLYRERTGALTLVGATAAIAETGLSQMCSLARGIWSMPPSHGPAIVATILASGELTGVWRNELDEMRTRIAGVRRSLARRLSALGAGDFSFIEREKGMFSFLGISPEDVSTLREQHSIYMVASSRINVAGLQTATVERVAEAIAAVIADK